MDLLAVQGTLKSLLQHHSSKASVIWHSVFFILQLSHSYMTTGKTIALTRWTFVDKVMSLLFNMLSGGGNEDNGDRHQQIPGMYCYTQCPQPCSRPLLTQDIRRQVWDSLLWGHCSFLLGPGAHKVLFVPTKSLFPQSCVSSGGSMVGLMATSSKRAYAKPRSAAPRARAPVAVHC